MITPYIKTVPIPCLRLGFALALACLPFFAQAESQSNCGSLPNHYGPYDYRTQRDKLAIVDRFHFTPQVEALIHGESGYLGGDLNYVLHTSPNHHRALIAMTRLSERTKQAQPVAADFTIDCYYDRAMRFAPDDVIVRGLYAQYLNRNGRRPEAVKYLDSAVPYAKEDGFAHYNIGLLYFELGVYDAALSEAWRAQELGFEREELMIMLKHANKWREPPPSQAASAASGASLDASEK